MLELARPLVVRRRVALATAVLEDEITIEGVRGVAVAGYAEAVALASTGIVPVVVAPQLPADARPSVVVDARMAKRNIDTTMDQAPLVVALGPGFTAGVDCHAVIETMRGHTLGRVIWSGAAIPNTGSPGVVAGKAAERVLRAPVDGFANWGKEIGDPVREGERIGAVDGIPIVAPFDGVLRGLIANGTPVKTGLKIGDVDARNEVESAFTISDKALSIGGGVVEAVLTHLSSHLEQVS